MTKIIKRVISIVLVLSMVLGGSGMVFADNTLSEQLKYVAIGDSFSSGYGFERFGWMNEEGSVNTYGQIFADYLEATYDSTLLMPGIRATDVYYMLDENFSRNDNYITHFTSHKNEGTVTKGCYSNVMDDVDIVSIKLGYNNYVNSFFSIMLADLGIQNYQDAKNFGTELSELLTDEEKQIAQNIYEELVVLVNTYFDSELVSYCQTAFGSVLNIPIGSHTLGQYLNYMAYSVAAGIRDFDNTLDYIYSNNSDAEVYVLQLNNPFDSFVAEYDLPSGKEVEVRIGDFAEAALNVFNIYYAVKSQFSTKLHFVADDEEAETIVSLAGQNDAVAQKFLSEICEELQIDCSSEANLDNFQKYAGVTSFNINSIITNLPTLLGKDTLSGLFNDSGIDISSLLSGASIKNYLDNYDENNDAIKLLMFLYLMSISISGEGSHPSQSEHTRIAELLTQAYNQNHNQDTYLSNIQAAIAGGLAVPNSLEGVVKAVQLKDTGTSQNKINDIKTVIINNLSRTTDAAAAFDQKVINIQEAAQTINNIFKNVHQKIQTIWGQRLSK